MLFEGPKMLKSRSLALRGLRPLDLDKTLRLLGQHLLRSGVRYMKKKNSKNKNTLSDFILPLQMHVQNHERGNKILISLLQEKA